MTGIDSEKVRTFSGKVPPEIRNAIAPLTNDKAWALFAALLTKGPMRFTDVKELFGTDSSGEISRILKALTTAGLIEQRAPTSDAIGNLVRSVYTPTALGRSLMRGLFEAVLPQPKIERVISRELMTVAMRRFRDHNEPVAAGFADYSDWSSTKTYGITFNETTYGCSSS